MSTWQIQLGPSWQRFATAAPHIEFLGTAQQQAQIGALGLREDGQFVLVNGAHETELSRHPILRALRKTSGGGKFARRHAALHRRADAETVPPAQPIAAMAAPVVIVKRRRRVIDASPRRDGPRSAT
ncbi:hypothetical protein HLB44_20805 [Aquincola sp. S2]|uniref:Uncharacterized protein n=1 Tax=Pseudaquabacterium terrae TaxID=2732868 RepID=A0ABX2ELJ7_9BURK|nr:hypothetical protein [Aquabacterium terrae]NRF69445.1 hypothetical protein [Aquabacterium terrae]